ncbi:hypothetical protein EJB05_34704, partial [Eragrostis curvula]
SLIFHATSISQIPPTIILFPQLYTTIIQQRTFYTDSSELIYGSLKTVDQWLESLEMDLLVEIKQISEWYIEPKVLIPYHGILEKHAKRGCSDRGASELSLQHQHTTIKQQEKNCTLREAVSIGTLEVSSRRSPFLFSMQGKGTSWKIFL